MTVRATKLGFIGLNTSKIDEMVDSYSRVMGLTISAEAKGQRFLSCGTEKIAVGLFESRERGHRYSGFQIAGEGPLDDVVAALAEHGVKGVIKSDLLPGIPSLVEMADCDGNATYLYREAEPGKPAIYGQGVSPDKIGHIALYTQDVQRIAKFYTDVLGFRWSDWCEDFFVFMRCNADHHAMNFIRSERQGMFHYAFELHDWAHMGRACDVLSANDTHLLWGPGRHGMGHNLFTYHPDPDRNVIELIAELDRMSDESINAYDPRPYHRDSPQRPKVWPSDIMAANMWGIAPPPKFQDFP